MKKIALIVILSICFADTKIGWVDSENIFNQLDESQDAQVELEKKQRSLEAEFMDMISRRDSLVQAFQTQAPLMGPEMKKTKENEIINFDKEIELFQMRTMGPDGELYAFYAQLLAPIEKKVRDAIEKVGKERGYDYILDSNSAGILYALDSHKLDEYVLEELRKGNLSE